MKLNYILIKEALFMNPEIFFILPLIQMAIVFTLSMLGIYTLILAIKALRLYIKKNS